MQIGVSPMNNQNSELMDIFMGMAQVTRCCRQDVAFCNGVTFHQFMILDAVAKRKEMPLTDLHTILAVEKSTTTRLVNPLIKKGLLKRDKAIHDSRAVMLFMTPTGREVHQNVSLCLENFFQKILEDIPVEKRTDVLEGIKVFISAIKNSAAEYSCCAKGE
jgi:DNA-binding MarR family transcriptional regulator